MEKMRMESMDIVAQNVEKIEKLFPDCIVKINDKNGKLKKVVNFDKLKQNFSTEILDNKTEHYEFTWVGKNASRIGANTTTNKTLRPCIEESKDWDNTKNLYIEGDNLEVLKLLQNSYFNKVKMIYIDPPYNTGNDFIYVDDFSQLKKEYEKVKGTFDEEGNRLFKNTDTNGRFHSDWCSMMYSRLLLARNLLANDGAIFISIDDNEQANLKKICDEVFGENNCIAQFPRITKKGGKSSTIIAKNHDYLLMYVKTKNNKLYAIEHNDENFKYKDEFFQERGYYKLNQTLDYGSLQYSKNLDYPLEIEGEIFYPGTSKEKYFERQNGVHNASDWIWRWSKAKFDFGYKNGFIVVKHSKNGSRVYTKTYQNATIEENNGKYFIKYFNRTKCLSTLEMTSNEYSNDNATKDITQIMNKKFFEYTKPISLLTLILKISTKNDIILDFFSGSATTAHAVMQLNAEDGGKRKFIMVQLPEKTDEKSIVFKEGYKNICEIGKERIRRAGEQIKEEAGLNGQDLDIGFRVLKLDSSNMKDIYYSADEYDQGMLENMQSNTKEDRTDLDLLFGCLVDWGLELDKPYTIKELNGHKVHIYNDGDLVACFEKNLDMETIDEIARLQALRVVFCDNSFIDSATKINVAEHFKMIAPDTDIKVI